jgi:hypothetical protein
LSRPIDYWLDPHTGRRWPDVHGKRIDYRHVPVGDPKWIWELNRCQELPILAQAWLLTGDERYAVAACDEGISWAAQNLPGRGVAWVNGYEAGLRAISLSVTFAALRHAGAPMSREQRTAFLRLLWQHGRWILRDPSTHSSANNHRLGEVVGLLVLAALTPELGDAQRWLHVASDDLADEAARQILGDGVGAEQAFTYHLYVLDLLLVAVAVLDSIDAITPQPVLDAICRSGDALWAQIGHTEPEPRYGDTDDAVALRVSAGELRDARSVAASVAACIAHPHARAVANSHDAAAWWLFGADGLERFRQTETAAPPDDIYLRECGLVILRRGEARITMDVGPLGYLSLAAHGHADALGLTLTTGGTEVVAFRGTSFHATVEVDDVSQSQPGGPFLWTKHAKVEVLGVDLKRGFVAARHDGYMRLDDPVAHQRSILSLAEGVLLVTDRLDAESPHCCRQRWPFHRDVELTREGDAHLRASIEGRPVLHLHLTSTAEGALEVARGATDPLAGWWSSRLEHWEPAPLASWVVRSSGAVHLVAMLLFSDAVTSITRADLRLQGNTALITLDDAHFAIGLDTPDLKVMR